MDSNSMPAAEEDRQYPVETAGRLMVPKEKVPTVETGATLSDVKELLETNSQDLESVDYIYVINKKSHLVGVISIKELFKNHHGSTKVDEIMKTDIVSVRASTHQQRTSLIALLHNIKAVPVLDKHNCFLGIITFDTVLKVLDKESVEDMLHMGGIYHHGSYDDLVKLSLYKSIIHRAPWLILGLIGGLLAAGIIKGFEEVISQNLVLAAFIPLIVYMADAVGTQMQTFIIRDLVINPSLSFTKYFIKQISVVSSMGLLISVFLFLATLVIYGDPKISVVLGISLFIAIMTSMISGLIVPYLFRKLKFDPANASGPISTIIQDILSVLVYFLVASYFL